MPDRTDEDVVDELFANALRRAGRQRLVRESCDGCEVQGRCAEGRVYAYSDSEGRTEKPCGCWCHALNTDGTDDRGDNGTADRG
jgi:hypothetical protein